MNKIVLSVFIALTMTTGARADIFVFSHTGMVQNYVVPAGVSLITISAWGAEGQKNAGGVLGGLGGFATGVLAVTPGQTLFVNVGGGGIISKSGGFNNVGGDAGTSTSLLGVVGGGGGGASDVRVGGNSLSNRVIVAAGGGGAGGNKVDGVLGGRGTGGGGGGGYYGGGGGSGARQSGSTVTFSLPTGGTQFDGGLGGNSNFTLDTAANAINDGSAGALGLGGAGGKEIVSDQDGSRDAFERGGAGGGFIGLDGATQPLFGQSMPPILSSFTGASGAGGSSFLGTLSSASTMSGVSPMQMGNGFVQFDFTPLTSVPEPSSLVLLILATLVTSCYVRFRGGSKPQKVVQRQ